jgi:hypothetical protein
MQGKLLGSDVQTQDSHGETIQRRMRRKPLFVLLAVGLFVAGFGVATFPAIAQLRVITITLAGGQQVTTTVDAPPDLPADQIQLPEITAPIEGVHEAPPATTKPKPKQPSSTNGGKQKNGGDVGRKSPKHENINKAQAEPKVQTPPAPKDQSNADNKSGGAANGTAAGSMNLPGPAPIGVPNFIINKFRIPPFLLPIYQAAGVQYGIRWEVLAAINEIETDYGRNLNVSSAGAVGWMQFLPSSWRMYGVDANRDRQKDPYNPVDAIFAAGRYLKAAGGDKDLRRAIFAYNHANWYVDSVLLRARLIAGVPADLVGSLTGLTEGHFPVHAVARYAGDLRRSDIRKLGRKVRQAHNAAKLVEAQSHRRSIDIFSRRGAPVIAVNDGIVKKVGTSRHLGRFIILQDVYGNRYTYAHLGSVSKRYPVPKPYTQNDVAQNEFGAAHTSTQNDPKLRKPTAPATAGRHVEATRSSGRASAFPAPAGAAPSPDVHKARLFANPARGSNRNVAQQTGQLNEALLGNGGMQVFRVYFSHVFRLSPQDVVLKHLKKGSKVIAGTILGRIGKLDSGPGSKLAPHLNFSIRPAGKGAPRIDPKPILDGWKLLEATAIYRAAGRNPFLGPSSGRLTPGQILLMSKEALARRVLADPDVEIYPCGRSDIRSGVIDRRVLATLEFLSVSGLRPTVTSLKCGHGYYTKSGNVSEHSSGNAVDIAKVNGVPILGHQGPGSITETTIRRLLALQGVLQPDQIISLMDLGPPTMVLPDHADHIHVGFRPLFGSNPKLGEIARKLLSNNQWDKLVGRLSDIKNPVVRTTPSKYSIKVRRRGGAGKGD